mgnify:CR=1 FL=1|tara:strand:- start:1532 stop:1759 length:228 start_codon:yes stop_codon:yes gene_type:complete
MALFRTNINYKTLLKKKSEIIKRKPNLVSRRTSGFGQIFNGCCDRYAFSKPTGSGSLTKGNNKTGGLFNCDCLEF